MHSSSEHAIFSYLINGRQRLLCLNFLIQNIYCIVVKPSMFKKDSLQAALPMEIKAPYSLIIIV